MNIDFHVHGILSKKLAFNEKLFLQGIEFAKNNNLDGFVLCEHFNAVDINSAFSFLKDNFVYDGDRYIVNGFSVYLGMEVDIRYGGHIIICGNREAIVRIKDNLQDYMKKSNFVPFEKLLSMGEEEGCLMIGSHPYRDNHKLYLQSESLLRRLHALDLNCKDIYKRGREIVEKEVSNLSDVLNIPYVTGSDSHYPIMLGSVKTCFEKEFSTIKELKELIRTKSYTIEVCRDLELKVYTAKVTKNFIKKKLKEKSLEE